MATDVDVQYFSHLNGLTLGNNWGDLIRLLDKALVTGIDFTQITAASIDGQGDVHITLYAAHNAMLFQVVELTGFAPSSLNQKYRIKGVPNTTQLILKPALDIAERSITTIGTGKLTSLGYDIIFRDTNDVKRVYRAKDPTAQHPFIRVDESIASDTGSYTNTYAKFAMVGLLEHMTHIDDYENPDVQQLPFDPSSPAKNWRITGTGTAAVRGWSRWYYAAGNIVADTAADSAAVGAGNRAFTLVGNKDSFIMNRAVAATNQPAKAMIGCGTFPSTLRNNNPTWFLAAYLNTQTAGTSHGLYSHGLGGTPIVRVGDSAKLLVPRVSISSPVSHTVATAITPDNRSGYSAIYNGAEFAALQVPFFDQEKILRGTLDHALYLGVNLSSKISTNPYLADNSMYVTDSVLVDGYIGAIAFYLGELE
ncbi:hypothetical protein [Acinetobacter schindleri]|uniref:hypothetical protein n=1 Tax=Acinetobacter schindleri TaxID=108981 RepID=UPI001621F6AE|nr:hypothetical protein [Acinetobacter schindleri]MBB4834966.1 hypothetical protein [Acinetobacter schindleri]